MQGKLKNTNVSLPSLGLRVDAVVSWPLSGYAVTYIP